MRLLALLLALLCTTSVGARAQNALTWGPVVARAAPGCDAFTPVRGPDGRHYTSYGDCSGLTGTLPRLSMGFGRIQGGPTNISVQDLPTPDLTDVGNRDAGYKPASALIVGTRMYMWIRNYAPGGTQSRLKYSDNFMQEKSTWTWSVSLTNFGYPVFVQGLNSSYIYIVAHDNNSAYVPADRFVMIRVPKDELNDRSSYEFFNGTPTVQSWTKAYSDRRAFFTARGKCFRSGMSYDGARKRYYWWRNTGDSKTTKSFEVWSGEHPWGKWVRIYSTTEWDMSPGERGEFPVAWMGREPISAAGTLHLLFSGQDLLVVRRATVAPGF
jgi:hypothetical protein